MLVNMKKAFKNPETTERRHDDVILTSRIGVRPACGCSYFSFPGLVWVCEVNRTHHWCQVGTEKSQPEGPPFQRETSLAEFPNEWWTRGLGFFWNH